MNTAALYRWRAASYRSIARSWRLCCEGILAELAELNAQRMDAAADALEFINTLQPERWAA